MQCQVSGRFPFSRYCRSGCNLHPVRPEIIESLPSRSTDMALWGRAGRGGRAENLCNVLSQTQGSQPTAQTTGLHEKGACNFMAHHTKTHAAWVLVPSYHTTTTLSGTLPRYTTLPVKQKLRGHFAFLYTPTVGPSTDQIQALYQINGMKISAKACHPCLFI